MLKSYTDEDNALLVIALLKAKGIRKVIASPGTTNMALVASLQQDSFFQLFSAVDERSASYMACGLAEECGEPVVISCTGATASRNYLPGLTEAFYRKLPVLAITSGQDAAKAGHLVPQVIDRSTRPNDVVCCSVSLPIIKDHDDIWACEVKINEALLALKRNGGGPAHINLPTRYSRNYTIQKLPTCRVIDRFTSADTLPSLNGRVAVFIGAHHSFSTQETAILDAFCSAYGAVVFCDHTSGYKGRFRVGYALVASQDQANLTHIQPEITIHIGEVSGDYSASALIGKEVWRIHPDGELRDTFRRLRYVFAMDEMSFFKHYTEIASSDTADQAAEAQLRFCLQQLDEARRNLPELPFSNIWIASQIAHQIPDHSVVHLGILNSLRSWNFFEFPQSVGSAANVGGFGIDGCVSSLIGASLADQDRLYFGIFGDLAFFYDMNALGNRHRGHNLRIMLVNNGKGTEFRNYNHAAAHFGASADAFISAAGHYGNQSPDLVRHYAESLGFRYLSASSKESFHAVYQDFLNPEIGQSVIFEVFTHSELESEALALVRRRAKVPQQKLRQAIKKVLPHLLVQSIKKLLRKT